jgi:hypothetical protein
VDVRTVVDARDERAAVPGPKRSAGHGWRRSAWTVASVALGLYLLWTTAYVASGHGTQDFIVLGSTFIRQSAASSLIRYNPSYHYTDRLGYDGQFCYFIALDPVHAHFYMDWPAYRYTRILYPMLARLLALGQPILIPYTLVLINLIAIAAGTLAVAAWLRRRGRSPWLALIFALSLGMFVDFNGDLTEPLAYALVALAIYLLDFGGARHLLWAAVCFALAILTRETTAVFAVLYGLALVLAGATRQTWRATVAANWRPTATLLGIALVPFALYKLFLLVWLGDLGVPPDMRFEVVPFAGILAHWPWEGHQVIIVETVILPALICAGMGIWALARRQWQVEVVTLLANVLLFVVLLPAASYTDHFAAARITIGVILAALYCVPAFDELTRGQRLWLLAATSLWMVFVPLQMIGLLRAAPAG